MLERVEEDKLANYVSVKTPSGCTLFHLLARGHDGGSSHKRVLDIVLKAGGRSLLNEKNNRVCAIPRDTLSNFSRILIYSIDSLSLIAKYMQTYIRNRRLEVNLSILLLFAV